MRGLRKLRIGDVGRVVTGKTPSTADIENFGSDFPFLTPTDMHGSKWARVTERGLSVSGASKLRGRVPAGSIAVSCIGWQMGKAILIDRETYTNQQINTIIPSSSVDSEYLYYYFFTRREELLSIGAAGGVRTPIISKSAFEAIEIALPSLPTQRRIAAILSSYDDLIENNARRIVILEEMARRIYEEWFVHFRFPGYEQVKMVESDLGLIPEGWSHTRLGDHLTTLESGKRPKGGITDIGDGVPSIGAENINGIGRHNFSSEKLVSEEFFSQMNKGIVRNRDVAVYKDGAYIGRSSYFRDGFPHARCCINEHVFLLRSNGKRLKQNFLYLWFQQSETVSTIRAANANAAQPGINQQTVGNLALVLPDEETARTFDTVVEPMLAAIINYARKNQVLRSTRDLLLPKLISGELDVSAHPKLEKEYG